METIGELKIRRHGDGGPIVIVLHGGPGVAGSAVDLAMGLSDVFKVVEPWQRASVEHEPLTVARHVTDLHDVVLAVRGGRLPALVGESWGAMLALAYAAEHPHCAGPIALVGCGTFDKQSRAYCAKVREERLARYMAEHPEYADDMKLDSNERILKWHNITDGYDPIPSTSESSIVRFDPKGHKETWDDMVRCQEEGLYPDAFSSIISPVIMLHGTYDPHPGQMIRDNLIAHIPHLEYREFDRCGHHPANEKYARQEFFSVLRDWLAVKCKQGECRPRDYT